MRSDETGSECPETLGEYLLLVTTLVGEHNDAAIWLKDKIATSSRGKDAKVLAADSQMRQILMPRMLTLNGKDIGDDQQRPNT